MLSKKRKMLVSVMILAFTLFMSVTTVSAYFGEPVVDWVVNLFANDEALSDNIRDADIIITGQSWKILDTTGNFDTYIANSTDKKTHIGWYLKNGIEPTSVDLTDRQLYDCSGNIILDDKAKAITLKYETNKVPNEREADGMSDGYFLRLTDASARNIDSCVQLNPTVVYQNDSMILYNDNYLEINVTLKKHNGEDFIIAPDEVWLDTTNPEGIKYGATDNSLGEGELARYQYELTSTGMAYEKEKWHYFYSDFDNLDTYTFVDFRDICNRRFEPYNVTRFNNRTNETVIITKYNESADCTFTLEENKIIVEFTSDKDIDPLFAGGTGTSVDPYQIENCTHLQNMKENLTSYFILNNDIDCDISPYNTGSGFEPIGLRFRGTLEGNGYSISDLFINLPTTDNVGLIKEQDSGSIQNLSIINADITGRSNVGILMGVLSSASVIVQNIFTSGSVTGYLEVGGVVGDVSYGATINQTSSSSDVTGNSQVGGVVGYLYSSFIDNSYATGNVTGTGDNVGGLLGDIQYSSAIDNSYWLNHTGNPNECLPGDDAGCTAKTDVSWFYNYSNLPMSGWDFTNVWDNYFSLVDHAILQFQVTDPNQIDIHFDSSTPTNNTVQTIGQEWILSNVAITKYDYTEDWNTTTNLYYENGTLVSSIQNNSVYSNVNNFTDLSTGLYLLNSSVIDNFGNTNQTETREIRVIDYTSYNAINVELPTFDFTSTTPVLADTINFNTSDAQTYFGVLSSMNVNKLTGSPGAVDVYIQIYVDNIELVDEKLRSASKNQVGATGITPFNFNVSNGQHHMDIYYYSTENVAVEISNVDFSLGKFITPNNIQGRGNLTLIDTSFTSLIPTTVWSKTINKNVNATTYLAVKLNARTETNSDTVICHFSDGGISPDFIVQTPGTNQTRSISTNYITNPESLSEQINLTCYSEGGEEVFLEGSLMEVDLKDDNHNPIQGEFYTNPATNYTNPVNITGEVNLGEINFTLESGNGIFISLFGSFKSVSGIQTPVAILQVLNSTGDIVCSSEKERYSSGDIGNVFFFRVCENLTIGELHTLRSIANVSAGELITFYDGGMSIFETTTFDTSISNTPPTIVILQPDVGTNITGNYTTIGYVSDTQPDDTHLVNLSLVNATGSYLIVQDLTSADTNYTFDSSVYADGYYNFTASVRENNTADNYSANTSNLIYIGNEPPSFIFTNNPINNSDFSYSNYQFNATITDNDETVEYVNASFNGTPQTLTNIGDDYYFNIPSLIVGSYEVCWYANDTLGNENLSCYDYYVSKKISTCQITGSNVTYPTALGVSGSCTNLEDNQKLYKDGVEVVNPFLNILGVGTYTFEMNVSETDNYTSATITEEFEVYQGQGEVATWISNALNLSARSNQTVYNGTSLWLNGSQITGDSGATINLYNEGSLINQGVNNIGNYTYFGTTGVYNITATMDSTQNYTADSETWFVNILTQPTHQCDTEFNYTRMAMSNNRPFIQLCQWRDFR